MTLWRSIIRGRYLQDNLSRFNQCSQELSTGYYATCKSNLQVQQGDHRQGLAN